MIIDNKLTSSKATLGYVIFIFLFLVTFIWSIANGVAENLVSLMFSVLFALLYLLLLISKPTYFSFKDSGDLLQFRFYNVHPFFMKPRVIKIQKKLLVKYNVQKKWFGLRKEIILHQKTPKGVAQYPAISVSALGPQQWNKLDRALKQQVALTRK